MKYLSPKEYVRLLPGKERKEFEESLKRLQDELKEIVKAKGIRGLFK